MRQNGLPSDSHLQLEDLRRRQLLDTAFRGGLSIALYMAFPAFSDVYRLWEREAGNPSFTPIPFEYPPVSAFYFEPLKLLASSRWAVAVNGFVMLAAAIAITWLLTRVADPRDDIGPDPRLWVASPALLFFMPINWDVLVALVAVVAIAALYDEREALAGLWSGIGTAFKIFPGAFVLPILPLIRRWRRRILFLGAGLVSLLLPYVIYAGMEPDTWSFHLQFASERSDIRSTVWGVIDWLAGIFGAHLTDGGVNALSAISIGVGLVALTWWVSKRKPTFAEVAALALIVMLTFNKVFKPQYILWVIPFLSWVRADLLRTRVAETATVVQFATIYWALPTFLYPLQAAVRVVALGWIALDIVKSASRRRASPTR